VRSTKSFSHAHFDPDTDRAHSNLFFAADFLLHLYAAESRYNFLIDSYVLGTMPRTLPAAQDLRPAHWARD
jgi:hypothetical protein